MEKIEVKMQSKPWSTNLNSMLNGLKTVEIGNIKYNHDMFSKMKKLKYISNTLLYCIYKREFLNRFNAIS